MERIYTAADCIKDLCTLKENGVDIARFLDALRLLVQVRDDAFSATLNGNHKFGEAYSGLAEAIG